MTTNSHGIEAYFTAAEFNEFSEYEKLRLRNMKQNYEMMIKVGKQHYDRLLVNIVQTKLTG